MSDAREAVIHRCIGLALTVVALLAGGAAAGAQTETAGGSWTVPRTAAGHPDLQGRLGKTTARRLWSVLRPSRTHHS